jgi:hypothetical protein
MIIAEATPTNSRCGTQRANSTVIGTIIGFCTAVAYLAVSMSYENKDPAAALGIPVIIGIGAAIGSAFDRIRHYCISNNSPRAETEATTFLHSHNDNANDTPGASNESEENPQAVTQE